MGTWIKNGTSKAISCQTKRIIRLIALHWFALVEYFERTGPGSCSDPEDQNRLREHIRNLSGPNEFRALYPEDVPNRPNVNLEHTNPFLILYWISGALSKLWEQGAVMNAPACAKMMSCVSQLHKEVCGVNKIDKVQFPLPYCQIVKLLSVVWVFTLPLVLAPKCGSLTPVFMALISMGFFGLDEVATMLESPFENGANDIDLDVYGQNLLMDFELVHYARHMEVDFLFDASEPIDFTKLMMPHRATSFRRSEVNLNLPAEHFKSQYSDESQAKRGSSVAPQTSVGDIIHPILPGELDQDDDHDDCDEGADEGGDEGGDE